MFMLIYRKRRSRPGTPPGTLIPKEVPTEKVKMSVISYSPDEYEEIEVKSLEEGFQYVGKREVSWISINSTQDAELLTKLGELLSFHPLALEDVMNAGQRPKVEDFDSHVFVTLRLPRKPISYSTESNLIPAYAGIPELDTVSSIDLPQVNIFLGQNFVVSIHDTAEDAFEPVIRRIKEGKGRIRKMGADYLAYALIDLVVDQYFPIMESVGEKIESIEDEIEEGPSPEVVGKIREIKRDLIFVRGSIWPMREVISSLQREDPELISDTTKLFLRDVYDHTIQIADIVESYRDILSEMFNVYLSVKADSTNEVMRILTIFATIFIPLTFVAGIYGMNFEFMPELKWKWAYFALLGLMGAIAIAMLRFFKKRGWM
jgi:magnesium transporter